MLFVNTLNYKILIVQEENNEALQDQQYLQFEFIDFLDIFINYRQDGGL